MEIECIELFMLNVTCCLFRWTFWFQYLMALAKVLASTYFLLCGGVFGKWRLDVYREHESVWIVFIAVKRTLFQTVSGLSNSKHWLFQGHFLHYRARLFSTSAKLNHALFQTGLSGCLAFYGLMIDITDVLLLTTLVICVLFFVFFCMM